MNKKQQKKLIFWGIVVIILIGFGAIVARQDSSGTPGKYTPLAQCLTEKGVEFYGAWWCHNCERQLANFGTAKDDLPYIECADANRQQNFTCTSEGIDAYPTWKFPDGNVITGVQTFEALAELSGCEPPA